MLLLAIQCTSEPLTGGLSYCICYCLARATRIADPTGNVSTSAPPLLAPALGGGVPHALSVACAYTACARPCRLAERDSLVLGASDAKERSGGASI